MGGRQRKGEGLPHAVSKVRTRVQPQASELGSHPYTLSYYRPLKSKCRCLSLILERKEGQVTHKFPASIQMGLPSRRVPQEPSDNIQYDRTSENVYTFYMLVQACPSEM